MRFLSRKAASDDLRPKVLILIPAKNVADCVIGLWRLLLGLTYPRELVSIGILEGDSNDGTYEVLSNHLPELQRAFRRAKLWKKDFGYQIPPGLKRQDVSIQTERRSIIARSRNHLLFHALDDEDWVLWIDADMLSFPADLIETLLATGKDIVHPNCVLKAGDVTFDLNAWQDQGRVHFHDLRGQGPLVPLDAVGGTVLLIRADLHRDGLIFPPFPYGLGNPRRRPEGGELETEGLGLMALDMGHQPWGMPDYEVIHRFR